MNDNTEQSNIFEDGWGILPRKLLLDQSLSEFSKVLYVELSCLCAERGYCWASNAYLSKRLGKSIRTVSSGISELVGYISVENGSSGKRKIMVNQLSKKLPPKQKTSINVAKNFQVNLAENFQQNSISINNINNTIESKDSILPEKLGKTSIQRIVNVYSLFWEDMYGNKFVPDNWAKLGKIIKSLLKHYSEWQIATMIHIHFNWKGASGTDEFSYKRLSENFFPFEWLPKQANGYVAYITNTLNIKFDDNEQVVKFIKPIIKELYDTNKASIIAG